MSEYWDNKYKNVPKEMRQGLDKHNEEVIEKLKEQLQPAQDAFDKKYVLKSQSVPISTLEGLVEEIKKLKKQANRAEKKHTKLNEGYVVQRSCGQQEGLLYSETKLQDIINEHKGGKGGN